MERTLLAPDGSKDSRQAFMLWWDGGGRSAGGTAIEQGHHDVQEQNIERKMSRSERNEATTYTNASFTDTTTT